MEHVKALLIKFVMIAVVLGIILSGIFGGELSDTLLISAVLTVLAYVLGDLFIFRGTRNDTEYSKRNMVATISDMVLTFIVVWLMGNALFTDTEQTLLGALLSAIAVGAGEWFFHKYLANNVFNERHRHESAH
ncbi:low temperature requirement protein LtrA [Peribacillus deserti]|uniref:Low temperature requirement protein LtrA n=1 Tax=Peribacillus deserti TaxID=673318 RepID=A0ABS2QN44_9BACI|nr:YndM family protein [Peribacillus deserti]MBM7694527.1 low temperature requirement protein LtrA [Peribacillus deserti]